jgi:outer membrane receptor protein involved in Fe transport
VSTKAKRGISNNNNQSFASPLYNFGYTPAIINLDSRTADGLYVRNPLPAGGGRLASNPFETLAHVKNQEDVYRMLGNSRVSFEALSGDVHRLTLSANGGVDRYNQTGQVYSPNFMQYEGRDGFFGRSVETTSNSLRANGALNGVWSFSPRALPAVFRTSGGLVQEFEDFSTVRVQARGLIPGIEKVNQGNIATNHDRSRIVDQAFYAQEEIAAFDDRVNVNFGLRADRSSANGDREKFYMFPKASAAYTFREPVAYVDRFKLRASVGQSGNRPRYGDRDITLQNNFRIGGQEGIGANPTLGNPDVKPERMTEQEYGFDATFAGARLALEATYFDRQITDLLLNAPLVNSSGLTQQIFNGGDMSSRGIELGLTVNPVRNWRGLGWVSRTNFFSIKQKVDSLPVSPFVVANSGFGTAYGRSRIAQGISTTAIWGNMPFYADATGKPLRVAPYGARLVGVDYSAVPGATQLVTRDTVVADATPDFEMSFSNEFTFRGFTLTALLDWRKGGYTSNLTNNLYDEGFTAYDYDKQVAVQRPGKADTTYKLGNYRYGSWATGQDARAYVQNGTFVKLREITLGYSVPEALVQRVLSGRGRDMRVNLSARNLAIWSAYWGMDPEVSNFGNQNVGRFVDLAPFPPSRSFFLSFDVGF